MKGLKIGQVVHVSVFGVRGEPHKSYAVLLKRVDNTFCFITDQGVFECQTEDEILASQEPGKFEEVTLGLHQLDTNTYDAGFCFARFFSDAKLRCEAQKLVFDVMYDTRTEDQLKKDPFSNVF